MSKAQRLASALIFLLLALFAIESSPAQDNPTGPEAGRELAAQLRAMQPTEDVKWRGTLKISGRDHKTASVPILCETTPGEPNWSVMYLAAATPAAGAEKLTVIFSTNAPNQYIYARAASPDAPLGEPKILTGAEADIPLAGSDFWLSDLGFEFYHWPDQVRLPGQMRRGRPCYVLQSNNPHPAPDGYSRVVTWVDRESGQPIIAEAYGSNKKLLKEFELGSVAKVNGRYQVKDLKMFDRKTGSRTYLDFDLQSQ
ncbi:MAG: putative sigma regulatory protein MucB/RseB [Pedosphaera sp.]|nr:putative sigma regulatory protein MucB/RseB [Pedosphaera sp.]